MKRATDALEKVLEEQPTEKTTAVGEASSEDWQAEVDMMAEDICMTCRGTGRINPLTAPQGVLCLSVMDCPHCEGAGVIQ